MDNDSVYDSFNGDSILDLLVDAMVYCQDTYGTLITDTGLEHLKGLTRLQDLALPPAITDVGLEHLKGLTSLRVLGLGRTRVTDSGREMLRKALPNCRIIR